MGPWAALAFSVLFALCKAEFTFPTTDQIRPFTLEESRYMADKVNEYRSKVTRTAGDLNFVHYNYEEEDTAAECTEEYDDHWCQFYLHRYAYNHETRLMIVDYTKFPTLESLMDSFSEIAELFDVFTGKPADTLFDHFYAAMVAGFTDSMACGLRVVSADHHIIVHCLFTNVLDSADTIKFGSAYTPSEEPCGLCPGIPCINNLCTPNVEWIARGLAGPYEATAARQLEEALNESVSIYHCLIAPFISLGLVFFL